MKAILNKIIVEEPEVKENVTATGIVLQKKVDRNASIAFTVASIGPDTHSVIVGDTILANNYAGMKFTWEEKNYRILNEDDVIAVL